MHTEVADKVYTSSQDSSCKDYWEDEMREEDQFWKESISSCNGGLSLQYLWTAIMVSEPGSQQTPQRYLKGGK